MRVSVNNRRCIPHRSLLCQSGNKRRNLPHETKSVLIQRRSPSLALVFFCFPLSLSASVYFDGACERLRNTRATGADVLALLLAGGVGDSSAAILSIFSWFRFPRNDVLRRCTPEKAKRMYVVPLVGLLPSPFPPISAGPLYYGLPLPVLRFYLATSSCNGAPSTSRETLTPDLRLDRTPRAGTPWRLSCFSRRRLNDSRSLFEPWRSESIHILLRRLL